MYHFKENLGRIREYYEERGILYTFQGENSRGIYEMILQKMYPKYAVKQADDSKRAIN